jgi:preprotein translocase subunit Sec63
LDEFAEGLPHLAGLLPRRQWEQFAATMADAEKELGYLENNAKAPPVVDTKTPSQNCYDVLRVSRDMTFDEIKIVYSCLVKTYSTDDKQQKMSESAKKTVERQWQVINDAWAEIERIHPRNAAGS